MDLEAPRWRTGSASPPASTPCTRIFYTGRQDIGAVVTIPPTPPCWAPWGRAARFQLPGGLRPDPMCAAAHASFGTPELARATFDAMVDRKASIMANHGLIAGDRDIASAFTVAEQIEQCCRVYVLARTPSAPR